MPNLIIILFSWEVNIQLQNYFQDKLQSLENLKLNFIHPFSKEKVTIMACRAEVIVGWRPSDELLKAAKHLKLYINPGAGVQHLIDTFRELNKERNVILCNGHGNAYFTAQHAFAILLTITNKVILHHNWMINGDWRTGEKDSISIPLKNRKIGLLGYGAINKLVHQFLTGFETNISVLRPSWKGKKDISGIKKFELHEIHNFLQHIDVLIIAIPETKETINLIGLKELKLLGKEGIIINVARGKVINQEALYYSLKEKLIAYAGIDVWYNYKPVADSKGNKFPWNNKLYPFHKLDNIVLSPHRGASPMDDLPRWDNVIDNIKKFATGKNDFLNIVDLEKGY